MKITSMITSRLQGAEKARRDGALLKMFFEEHNGKPKTEIAIRFLSNLGSDVNSRDKYEVGAYTKGVDRFLDNVMKAEPDIIAELIAAKAAVALAQMVPLLSEEEIDEIAIEHGHTTREEQDGCIAIVALRARRELGDRG